ncbi:MAG: DUF1559 domain-containing protein [Planctomycetaceae bacterium]|nr:DUF1559 domain-containing protein [Planctomycetaceae bacterium]
MPLPQPTEPPTCNPLPTDARKPKKKRQENFGNSLHVKPLGILVAVVVFSIFVVLLWKVLPHAHDAARHNECANNMKEIVLAFHMYYSEHGHFPPVYTVDEDGKPLHSWRVLILPYIGRKELYEKIRLNEPWNSEHNCRLHSECLSVFQCPGSGYRKTVPARGDCFYSVIDGSYTESTPREKWKETIFLVERKTPVNWMDPSQEISFETAIKGINTDAMGIGSDHGNYANVAFGDGNVRYFKSNAEGKTRLRAYITKK